MSNLDYIMQEYLHDLCWELGLVFYSTQLSTQALSLTSKQCCLVGIHVILGTWDPCEVVKSQLSCSRRLRLHRLTSSDLRPRVSRSWDPPFWDGLDDLVNHAQPPLHAMGRLHACSRSFKLPWPLRPFDSSENWHRTILAFSTDERFQISRDTDPKAPSVKCP